MQKSLTDTDFQAGGAFIGGRIGYEDNTQAIVKLETTVKTLICRGLDDIFITRLHYRVGCPHYRRCGSDARSQTNEQRTPQDGLRSEALLSNS